MKIVFLLFLDKSVDKSSVMINVHIRDMMIINKYELIAIKNIHVWKILFKDRFGPETNGEFICRYLISSNFCLR